MPETSEAQNLIKASIFDATFETWCLDHYPAVDASAQWDYFVRQCLAKDYRYARFRQAFQNSFTWENSPAQRTSSRTSPASQQETRLGKQGMQTYQAAQNLMARRRAREGHRPELRSLSQGPECDE